ncbi:preprotein translocase subunit SecY [Erysipelotrichaceae bacterium Oil+RF-744-GAM-WT-6]|jgi:preprotein translocase subunit SecY|uniref:Protein translocase subunit SecY n=1 Tax=Stecheria intestinalis TaxID=2606630 RepID=A0A7X2NS25_9FIRM|nr:MULTISPECIES: preprotein translocase subunit SecY [Erysipelotrichaceae]MCI2153609.1 preprotein translocase subunit SecY [Solobacterium sp.]MDY4681334.1 preprotein translocase subunit SecY [Lachnospiraceae bacterium]MCI6745942.1 preprotein translocase subunit SecY [Anaerolactibacter massiliensis]MDD5881562.1 preprotein translocase subunit SecY [Stecheria intestinalis]MDD7679921.1 preprotein translocase subunit SecY [Stecheria intestinalis]
MMHTFASLFRNKEIRKKIFFTLAMLLIYRIGSAIPVPGVDSAALSSSIADNSILNMMNLLGGGAFERMSVFALGVTPYITASIIIQLLSMDVIPALTEMAKSGETGRIQMDKITRYLAVVLAFVQAYSMVYGFDKQYGILTNSAMSQYLYTATILTAGTQFLVWIGDRISMFGIGNGISIIIFAGIVSNMPASFAEVWSILVSGSQQGAVFSGVLQFVLYCVLYFAIIVGVVIMELAVRKIPIQYTSSSNVRGAGDITYLPFKINSASVIPVIFASSIMTAPQIILSFIDTEKYTALSNFLSLQKPVGLIIYAVLTFLFTFFYTDLQVDPDKVAENLGKSGAYIPGIRPGSETRTYLHKVLNRITVLGAAALTVIAVIPYLLPMFTSLPTSVSVGGTGIIIVVGVAMETMAQLKGQLTQKQYHGFLK